MPMVSPVTDPPGSCLQRPPARIPAISETPGAGERAERPHEHRPAEDPEIIGRGEDRLPAGPLRPEKDEGYHRSGACRVSGYQTAARTPTQVSGRPGRRPDRHPCTCRLSRDRT